MYIIPFYNTSRFTLRDLRARASRQQLTDMSGRRANLTSKRKKLLKTALTMRDETAEPVVKRVHRRGTARDPLRGLYESRDGSKARCPGRYRCASGPRCFTANRDYHPSAGQEQRPRG